MLTGSAECQQFDWKSGHQTACAPAAVTCPQSVDEHFQFYEIPYVAHWAINLEDWKIRSDSKEYLGRSNLGGWEQSQGPDRHINQKHFEESWRINIVYIYMYINIY